MCEPARYTCYRAAGPIVVDGKLDERSWQLAPQSTPFVDIVTGEPAWFDNRVARRLLRIRSQRAKHRLRGLLDLEGHSRSGWPVLGPVRVRSGVAADDG